MELNNEQTLEMMQYAFTRLDGGWFLAAAKSLGIEQAWQLDVEAWTHFSYVFGKKVRKDYIPEPVWPDSFVDTLQLFSNVLKIEGREVEVNGSTITVRVTDCETQKMIAKAGIADCGIVTVQTYYGLIRGLFADEVDVEVVHAKNLNHGDECCEVVINEK
ncbi:MAG: DUF6125 family protein [Bacillota bacterium]|nr:DUF6125 family protein [Bacillota bacterium]